MHAKTFGPGWIGPSAEMHPLLEVLYLAFRYMYAELHFYYMCTAYAQYSRRHFHCIIPCPGAMHFSVVYFYKFSEIHLSAPTAEGVRCLGDSPLSLLLVFQSIITPSTYISQGLQATSLKAHGTD